MAKPKFIPAIDCDAAASQGIQAVLIARMEEMCSLRKSALAWSDPEGVHDMRVASRRLRSALRDFMPYIRKRSLSASLRDVKTIADALGEVRDQDVAIPALEKLVSRAPHAFSDLIAGMVEGRKADREKARAELNHILRARELKRIQSEFSNALAKSTTQSVAEKRSTKGRTTPPLSYHRVAQAVITDRLNELEELSFGLYQPLEAEPLHKLRIAAKHLRYALELFEQCWGEPFSIFAKKVAGLQSSLGELHDCDIWIESFGGQLAQATKEKAAGKNDCAVWLLSHFIKLRTKYLREALVRWCEWEASDFSGQLRESLKHPQISQITQITLIQNQ
jgi:CHAD domain-containing protein